jgi:hypothetical protein
MWSVLDCFSTSFNRSQARTAVAISTTAHPKLHRSASPSIATERIIKNQPKILGQFLNGMTCAWRNYEKLQISQTLPKLLHWLQCLCTSAQVHKHLNTEVDTVKMIKICQNDKRWHRPCDVVCKCPSPSSTPSHQQVTLERSLVVRQCRYGRYGAEERRGEERERER